MFNDLRDRVRERAMTLEVDEEARRFIAREGFDPVYGARPLRRYIAREIETRIGRALLTGEIEDGAVVRVELEGDRLFVRHQNPPA
jgi:ATP-dependent Clp protease ATP-binding subunit ClpB